MFYADTIGLTNVIMAMNKYAKGRHGDAWKPAPLMVRLAAPAFLMAHSEMGEIQPESIKLPIGVQLRIPASQSITLKPDGSDTSIKAGILIIWPTSNSSAGPRADHEVQSLSGKTLLLLPDGGNMALTHGATSLRFAETTD